MCEASCRKFQFSENNIRISHFCLLFAMFCTHSKRMVHSFWRNKCESYSPGTVKRAVPSFLRHTCESSLPSTIKRTVHSFFETYGSRIFATCVNLPRQVLSNMRFTHYCDTSVNLPCQLLSNVRFTYFCDKRMNPTCQVVTNVGFTRFATRMDFSHQVPFKLNVHSLLRQEGETSLPASSFCMHGDDRGSKKYFFAI
jgi:hypothetical protein